MGKLDREEIRKLKLSGRVLRETIEEIRQYVREGTRIVDVCEKAESLVREKGGKPAFPCNVSIDEIAAHYTSPPGDERVVPKNSIVKVDVGVHIDGYLTDSATTVCFNPQYRSLVEAAEQALKTALNVIRPEISTSRIGSIIEQTIRSHGFRPISNLTGHNMGRYLIHAGTSIPNVSRISLFSKVRMNEVYAIEPFVTLPDAVGKVENGSEVTIFRFLRRRSVKSRHAKALLEYIETEFRTLPFAERWIQNVVPREHYRKAFSELLSSKALMGYPVFVEASRKPVAQAEHTVLIIEKGCEVLT